MMMIFFVMPLMAEQRKKVAVVLSGGGAKGVAHIGVLKVLDEAGIPIDYVVGTSMGSIVGGLYAIGYTPAAIDSMVQQQDWPFLLSDKVQRNSQSFPEKENAEKYILSLPFGKEKKDRKIFGVIKGQNLYNLFSDLTIGYHDSVDFNSFYKPFACVAVNAVNGKEYVFHNGSLPLAMRASMAIPAVFTPVRLDSMLLIDGGLNNNYPADVAKEMGADIIIGVDLQPGELKEIDELNGPADVISQIVTLHSYEKYKKNLKQTDLLIRPNMASYNSASFTAAALDTLIRRGERAARSRWDDIIALKQKIGISKDFSPDRTNRPHPVSSTDTFFIRRISFQGIDPRDEKWLTQISGLQENSYITREKLQQAMSVLVGTNAYSSVSYKLAGEEENDLILTVQEKSISSVNLGLRFDTEEIVAVLLNATLDYRARYHSKLAFTGRVGGKMSYARLDYGIERTPLRNFNMAYMFSYHDLDIYKKGEKTYNTAYRHHLVELGYSDMNWLSFKFQLGLRYEYFDYNNFLFTDESLNYSVKPESFISYFALAHFETMDRRYFPTKGVSLRADYSVYTDNFVNYNGHTPFSALSFGFNSVLPLTSHFSILPSINGRILIGKDIAYPFLNAIGGDIAGKYVPQQLPFAGINHMELLDNSLAMARVDFRQRIGERHYISLVANCAIHHNDFWTLLKGKYLWGGSLGYAYNSIAGPMSVNFGLANQHRNLQFFMNLGYYF